MAETDVDAFIDILDEHQVPYGVVGTVGGDMLAIQGKVDVPVDMLREAHAHTLERLVGGQWQPEELREG